MGKEAGHFYAARDKAVGRKPDGLVHYLVAVRMQAIKYMH
jgi:hypothetical protein